MAIAKNAELYAQIVGKPKPAQVGQDDNIASILAKQTAANTLPAPSPIQQTVAGQIGAPNINVAAGPPGATAAPRVNPAPVAQPAVQPRINVGPTTGGTATYNTPAPTQVQGPPQPGASTGVYPPPQPAFGPVALQPPQPTQAGAFAGSPTGNEVLSQKAQTGGFTVPEGTDPLTAELAWDIQRGLSPAQMAQKVNQTQVPGVAEALARAYAINGQGLYGGPVEPGATALVNGQQPATGQPGAAAPGAPGTGTALTSPTGTPVTGGVSIPGVDPALLAQLEGQAGGQGLIDPATLQAAQDRLNGTGPQADPNAFQYDQEFLGTIQSLMRGEGLPTYDQMIKGEYEPVAQHLDRIFGDAQTQAFEDLISRGVLSSGEATKAVADLANQLGTSKAQVLGQVAANYATLRQNQIQAAVQQYGILESGRASMHATITSANLQAAVSTQNAALQTLTSLSAALVAARTDALQTIAGLQGTQMQTAAQLQLGQAQIASSENIAGAQMASAQTIAAAQMAASTQIAQINAQAMLQANQFDADLATQQLQASMTLQGVDWARYQSDPLYAQQVTDFYALRADTELAIQQAAAVGDQLNALPGGGA